MIIFFYYSMIARRVIIEATKNKVKKQTEIKPLPDEPYYQDNDIVKKKKIEFIGDESLYLEKYHDNITYFITNTPKNNMSDIRNEICQKIRHRSLFQKKVFGRSSTNYDVLPENSYEGFTVSLYLVIRPNSFSLTSAVPGFEISESFDDEGKSILSYISQGFLIPKKLPILRNLNLVWYDGGLICEISDQRRSSCHITRTLLKPHPVDITQLSEEHENQLLLNLYPSICFDADTRVAKISRAASSDYKRWMQDNHSETPKGYINEHYPEIFLPKKKEKVEETDQLNHEELGKLILKAISNMEC